MLLLYTATRSPRLFVFNNIPHRTLLHPFSTESIQPSKRRGGRPSFLVSNLNPASLVETDKIDISLKTQLTIPDDINNPLPSPTNPMVSVTVEGGVRFRLAQSPSPSSFAAAPDLLCTNGAPWQLTLPQLTCRKYPTLLDQLLHESLISPAQIAHSQHLFRDERQIYCHNLIFRLTQEFPVNFRQISLVVVGEDAIHHIGLPHPFHASKRGVRWYPWAGSAIARFERSTDAHHAGRRIIHLRILRIVGGERVSHACDDEARRRHNRVLEPEAGQLLLRVPYGAKEARPWAYDIDEDPRSMVAVGLGMLWERDEF
ncbi:hypothetical protein R3P38DRAFT_3450194 [Favolaschia claudopus]|uniref:Uncharacterized protein n=1 Tax=Favolaschia claudopus TaxID=2862362 RepID=A0AAV9ZM79_9AGAR